MADSCSREVIDTQMEPSWLQQAPQTGHQIWQSAATTMSDADLSEAVNLFELTSGLNSLDELIPASALSPLPGEARPIPAGNLPAVSTSSDRSAASRSLNGEKAKQSAATGAKHREDLKAIRNREAQKRFKQKQKVALSRCRTTPSVLRLRTQHSHVCRHVQVK